MANAGVRVYVVIQGEYEDAEVVGVYSTLQKAQEAFLGEGRRWRCEREGGYRPVWVGGRYETTITEYSLDEVEDLA